MTFGVLLFAIGTASLSLLLLSGVMAYGWPFFYVYLLSVKENSNCGFLPDDASIRPSIVGAH